VLFELEIPVEASTNIFTVALRSAEGGDKETQCWGYNRATFFLEDKNTGTWPSRLVGLIFETAKHANESCGTRTGEWLRWRAPAAIVDDRTTPEVLTVIKSGPRPQMGA
jgi:hypothetical protein